MRRFRLPILVLSLCLGLGGLWAYAADPTGSNTSPPANTTTGTCTGTGCGTNTSGTTTGTCTGANCGTNTNVATTTFTGAGDVVASASGWWGLRAYTAAIATAGTQKLINIRRASDSETCDIIVATSGGFGLTANCSGADSGLTASAFCNATTCAVTKAYDQAGSHDLSQATAAQQPALTFNCIGTNPCLTTVAASNQGLLSAAFAPSITQPFTFAGIFDRTGNIVQSTMFACNVTDIEMSYTTANNAFIFAGTIQNFTISDSALHVVQGIYNGATSAAYVDGVTTSSLNPGAAGCTNAAEVFAWMKFASTVNPVTGTTFEVGIWPVGFTGAQRTSMCKNEQAYLGSGNFGAAC